MLTWSTDDLPSHQRFEHWREERAKAVFGVQIDVERDKRGDFEGHFTARQVGSATIAELRASAYHVTRSEGDITDTPADAFCISQQLSGGGLLVAGGDEHVVAPGALVIGHSDRPYVNIPAVQPGFTCRIIKVPYARVAPLLGARGNLALRPVATGPGVSALLAAYLAAFVEQAPALTDDAADVAVDTLVRLALLAWDTSEDRDPASVAAIRRGQFERARWVIEQHVIDPALSPGFVAAALGISVRQLHLVFETTGSSFSLHVRRRRLHQAHHMLTASPRLTVTEIAYASGFESMATFFRCFRAEHGCTPGDVRHARSG